jgi:hypothetical protein
MGRPAIFVLVGLGFLGYWLGVDLSRDETAAQSQWSYVLLFTAVLLLLGVGLVLFGAMLQSPLARRAAYVAGAGAVLCGAANVVEDGLGVEWVFLVFVSSLLVTDLALFVVMATVMFTEPGARRMLALVPIGTVIGIAVFVEAGGVVMAVTWVGAGVASYLDQRRPASIAGDRMSA